MRRPSIDASTLNQRLSLDVPGTATPDGDGGYTPTWLPLTPPKVWAAIVPATARDVERRMANTVQAAVTHLVTIRYHAGVTMQTRLTKGPRNADGTLPAGSRQFQVTGIQNPEERNEAMVLACVEIVP